MTTRSTPFRLACLAGLLTGLTPAHASQEDDCVASILGMLRRAEPIDDEPDGVRSDLQLRDLIHGRLRRGLGPNTTIVNETADIAVVWDWAEGSVLSEGSPLAPGTDWRVARTPPVDAFSGGITVVGDGPIPPDVVEGRSVATASSGVTWRTADRMHWRARPAFPTPSVPSLLLGTGSSMEYPNRDFDKAGIQTLSDVITVLLTELLTEPSPVP